jgi:hypothetical protein
MKTRPVSISENQQAWIEHLIERYDEPHGAAQYDGNNCFSKYRNPAEIAVNII